MAVSAAERASFREAVGGSLAALVAEVARERDLGAREIEVGRSLSQVFDDVPEELVGEAFDLIAETPRGSSVLEATSVAGETSHAVSARVRLEEVGEDATPAALHVVAAWELIADGEPSSALTLLCERTGERGAQAFTFVIEEPVSGGAVKHGFATGLREGRKLVKRLRANAPEETELIERDADVAYERLVEAAKQGARVGLAPDADGLLAVRIFLRAAGDPEADAIVQALELLDPLSEAIDRLTTIGLAEALEGTLADGEDWFAEHSPTPELAGAGMEALQLMGEFGAYHALLPFDEWSSDVLDDFMLEWMPQAAALDVERFPDGITQALSYLAASGRLELPRAAVLMAHTASNRAAFAQAMADERRQGPAAAIAAAMRADGVTLGDEGEMQAWIDRFNALSRDERDAVLGPALPAWSDALAARSQGRSKRKHAVRKAQKQARRRNRRH